MANDSGARTHTMAELMALFGNNPRILDAAIKTEDHILIQASEHGKIMVSISGGSDSDIMMDMFEKLGYDVGEVVYVWFDTGLEYEATKRHLKDLEAKYGVKIKRYRPKMTVAQACKRYGIPVFAKHIAKNIGRLQLHAFTWENKTFDTLFDQFPRNKSSLKWWCSMWPGKSMLNISSKLFLKEFMLIRPPREKFSSKCCDYAKKATAKIAEKELCPTLSVVGIRKEEGGERSMAYNSCFSDATDKRIAQFRPIFYFSDADKKEYKDYCGVTYSDCYEVWGLTRTGCVCCPFGSRFEEELEIVKQYEPKLYAAACKIFGPSYEYTRQYRRFKESLKREKRRHGQIDLFDRPEDQIER